MAPFTALASACAFTSNSAFIGGGSVNGVLSNCVLNGNTALEGGGIISGTLVYCTLTGNSARDTGGGANGCTVSNCWFSGNGASQGGGVGGCPLVVNCTFVGNSAGNGGAAASSSLNNCLVTGNTAFGGGGAASCGMNNCTVTGNSAQDEGGGVEGGTYNNCIIYFNSAPSEPNYLIAGELPGTLNYCCTTPPLSDAMDMNNISADPLMTDFAHISAASPCRGAGSAAFVSGVDIDGQPWANPPSIGCDEYYAGAFTGSLSVSIQSDYTNVTPAFPINFTCQITGNANSNVWDFGDGSMLSNHLTATHSWLSPGDYPVVFIAFNNSNPGGVSTTILVHVAVDNHYVDINNTNPVAPYTSWATAATNIQDAVDAAMLPGGQVFVTNGVYASGGGLPFGPLTNRVAITNIITVQSMNGPWP